MKSFSRLIEDRAKEHGDKRFLTFEGRDYSYSELLTQVRTYAEAFASQGVGPGTRVGIMMKNSPEHIFVYLGLSWIGATIVEFSVFFKSAGLELQLNSSDVSFFVADSDFFELVASTKGRAATGRTFWHGACAASNGDILLSKSLDAVRELTVPGCSDLDRLHAISFTSGTTGKPKGAMLSDRFFQIGARSAGVLADVRSDDVLFLWEPFYHVAGWMTVLMSLQHGVPIYMVERFSASKCWDQVRQSGATLLHYLGGVMNILLKQPERPDDSENPVRIAWGAAAPARNWVEFEQRFGVRVREGYGLSEGGNFTHLNIDGPVGSIGKPIEEFESWVADEAGNRLPPNKVGEIVLRPTDARNVMQGFFRDEQATKAVKRGGCIYTGDLAYMNEQGYFFFAGRKKDSLRRRGENISAWEVERVLNAHPAVEESAIVGVSSEMGEQDIKAFIKCCDGPELNPLELIKWCEQELTYYQIPRFIEFVDEFPRGPTHRIRKKELSTRVDVWDLERSGYSVAR